MALLPWHQEPLTRLHQLREQGRLSHAWLIDGPAGAGKLAFSKEVARWLFCAAPTQQGACGRCQDCHLFEVGSHPDWLLLEPEKKLLKVDQVRELIDFAQLSNQRGSKVLVLAPAEAMNLNAANALLKILEEPPPDTLLLLVSQHSAQLLPTLRSRCQRLSLSLPEPDAALRWLREQGVKDAEKLLAHAQGAPLKALAMAEDDTLAAQDAMLAQLDALLANSLTAVQAAKACEKFPLQTSIEYLLSICQALLRAVQAELTPPAEFAPLWERLRQSGAAATLPLLLHAYQQQAQAAYKVAQAPNNANALLMLEALFGDWVRLRERLRRAARFL
ncbi:MAG: DNA polymerase III subunit delta' [Pseudomonadales bacterium]|jgi:DNA polymerase-3 subunit delta'|nr:DNA polymerase III subunit delta' [Pseudomonadales bacterium]